MIRAQFITIYYIIISIITLSPYSNNKGYHEISALFFNFVRFPCLSLLLLVGCVA